MRRRRERDEPFAELEEQLRNARPQPRPELVRAVARRVRSAQPFMRGRLALAGALTAVMLVGVAATGGVGYAASAARKAASAVQQTVGAKKNDGKVRICHATGSQSNPYVEIEVNANGLSGHGGHKNDIVPAPSGGCPKPKPGGDLITICHKHSNAPGYATQQATAFGHRNHPDDIIPAPAGGCPATKPPEPSKEIVTICHKHSNAPGYATQRASAFGHRNHPLDIIPAPAGGCPARGPGDPPAGPPGKVKICHATGSSNNPYVLIEVSTNGLNGHGNHPNDIIPAPAGGCPGKTPGEDQYKPGKGCGDKNHVHFKEGQCKDGDDGGHKDKKPKKPKKGKKK